jgi:hypothetical protein
MNKIKNDCFKKIKKLTHSERLILILESDINLSPVMGKRIIILQNKIQNYKIEKKPK